MVVITAMKCVFKDILWKVVPVPDKNNINKENFFRLQKRLWGEVYRIIYVPNANEAYKIAVADGKAEILADWDRIQETVTQDEPKVT